MSAATTIRRVPALHAALLDLAREHQWLDGPVVDGRPTRWYPCDAEGCATVVAVDPAVLGANGGVALLISVFCEDCAAPCDDPECELLVHAHGRCETCGGTGRFADAPCGWCEGSGRGPCEVIA